MILRRRRRQRRADRPHDEVGRPAGLIRDLAGLGVREVDRCFEILRDVGQLLLARRFVAICTGAATSTRVDFHKWQVTSAGIQVDIETHDRSPFPRRVRRGTYATSSQSFCAPASAALLALTTIRSATARCFSVSWEPRAYLRETSLAKAALQSESTPGKLDAAARRSSSSTLSSHRRTAEGCGAGGGCGPALGLCQAEEFGNRQSPLCRH